MWNQVKLGILEVKIFFMAEERGGREQRKREIAARHYSTKGLWTSNIFFYELSRHAFY